MSIKKYTSIIKQHQSIQSNMGISPQTVSITQRQSMKTNRFCVNNNNAKVEGKIKINKQGLYRQAALNKTVIIMVIFKCYFSIEPNSFSLKNGVNMKL